MLNKTQVKIILILLDNKGHPEWELAEHLNIADSNLNPVLKKLEDMKRYITAMRIIIFLFVCMKWVANLKI